MVVSARAKSRHGLIGDTVADLGVNDNSPGMHPGHELSDLRNAPRQAAAEAVVHYTRLSLIEAFPQDPRSASSGRSIVPPMDEKVEMQSKGSSVGNSSVTIACFGSLICHAALVAALLVGFVVTPQAPVEEAGDVVSVIILGDSEADQASAGEDPDEPQPQEIVAESVRPQTVQAAEVPPVAEPVQAEAVAPTQEVTRVSPENATTVQPEILTSQAPAETAVVQPMASEMPAEISPQKTPPLAATPPTETTPVQPAETAEIAPEPDKTLKPDPKPVAEKPVQKPRPAEKKQPPKKLKVAAGSQGDNDQDSKRGSADGSEAAASDRNSRSAGNSGGAGSAAVANYPGKVQSRIRRSVKVPTEYKRMSASMSVRIRLSIGSTGGISGLSVARSSGIPELDQAVVEGVRRAAPFPPLPAEWGKPIWTFTQEVQVTGR
jgi:protein TonB